MWRLYILPSTLVLMSACSGAGNETTKKVMVHFMGCAAGSQEQCEALESMMAKVPPERKKQHFFKLCYKYDSQPACAILAKINEQS